MATTIPPTPEAPAPLSAVARLTGVLFSPKQTFADIARKPSWVVPVIVLTIVWLALNLVMVRRADWVEVKRQQIERVKMAAAQFETMTPEQRAAAYEQQARREKITRYVRGVIGWPLLLVVMSGIYLGAYKLIGGARLNFSTAFAICAFAHIPMGIRELLGIPVVLLKEASAIDPDNFLASNVAAFLGNDAPLWQLPLLGALDIFGLWAVLLVAVGFSAADPKKLPFGKSLGIALGILVVFVLFFTGIAWMFS
jgi:Yip1 domain